MCVLISVLLGYKFDFFFFLQLPTLYFAVLMLSHVLDHFIFSSRRYTKKTKNIVFAVLASIIVLNFWWFKGLVFGILGPIGDYKGLQWRKVCDFFIISSWNLIFFSYNCSLFSSRGIFIISWFG